MGNTETSKQKVNKTIVGNGRDYSSSATVMVRKVIIVLPQLW